MGKDGFEIKVIWKQPSGKHILPDYKFVYSDKELQEEIDKLNHNLDVDKIMITKQVFSNCQMCKKDFPEDFGGTMCPRCEKIYYDAREEQLSENERNW